MESLLPSSPSQASEPNPDRYRDRDRYAESFIYTDSDGDKYTVSVTYTDGISVPHCHVKSNFNPKHGLRDSQ